MKKNLNLTLLILALACGTSSAATNVYWNYTMPQMNGYWAKFIASTSTWGSVTGKVAQVDFDVADATLASTTGTVATLVADLDTAEATLASTTGTVATLVADLDTAEATLASTTGNVAQVASDLSDLSGIVTTATGNVAQVTSDLSDLSGIVTTATGNVATVTGTLAAGISTNFTFLSATDVTGQVWFASGILTNVDLNIGD